MSTSTSISTSRRIGRTFGYLGLFLLWALILAIVVGVIAIIPASIGNLPDGLQHAPAIAKTARDGSELIAFLVCIPLVTSILGYAFYALTLLPLANAFLALTYFFRSFLRKYKDEPLSMTRWSSEGIGTIRLGYMAKLQPKYENKEGVAISLLPIQKTKFTSFWTTIVLLTMTVPSGVKPFFTLVYGVALVNLAYFVTIGWYYWPVREPLGIAIWSIISIALFVYGLVIVIRSSLQRVRQWQEEDAQKATKK